MQKIMYVYLFLRGSYFITIYGESNAIIYQYTIGEQRWPSG